jgi:hypothetical protein
MAIIKLGGLISDIQGKVGGAVFQRSAFGLSMRSQASGKRQPSSAVMRQLAIQEKLQFEWQQLTDLNRGSWSMFATVRPRSSRRQLDRYLSGHQVFLLENNARQQLYDCGNSITPLVMVQPVISSAPANYLINQVRIVSSQLSTYSPVGLNLANEFLLIYASAPCTNSSNSSNKSLKLMRVASDYGTAQVITNAYKTAYGMLPVIGQRIVIGWYRYDAVMKSISAWNQQIFTITV